MLPFSDEVTSAVLTIIKMTTYFGQFGTIDFIEYWTAFRLFISQIPIRTANTNLILPIYMGTF